MQLNEAIRYNFCITSGWPVILNLSTLYRFSDRKLLVKCIYDAYFRSRKIKKNSLICEKYPFVGHSISLPINFTGN